jgi:hypothetical protein
MRLSSLINRIRELFVARDDVYAVQREDGSYLKVEAPLTDEVVQAHLRGELTLGVYQLDRNSNVKWICLDFDGSKPEALRAHEYFKAHDKYARACALEDTGGRGAHVWVFVSPPIPAKVARYLALEAVKKLDVTCEVFPKQEEVEPGGYGSLVKLPLGIHRKYGRWSVFLDPGDLNGIEPVEVPREVIEEIEGLLVKEVPAEEKVELVGLVPWWAECKAFDRIIRGDIEEGTRNECGFWLARLMRNSCFPSWLTRELLLCWNRHLKCTPLPEREIETIAKSVYSKGYAIGRLSLRNNPETSVYCEGCINSVCLRRKTEKKVGKKSSLIKPYGVL